MARLKGNRDHPTLLCDICGDQSRHFIDLPDGRWACVNCIDLQKFVQEIVGEDCLNGMEVCRIFNGVEDPRVCVLGHKFGVTRGWQNCCNYQRLNCTFHYCRIYDALRYSQRKGKMLSLKTRFYDHATNGTMKTDVFRFWFTDPKAFQTRVLDHMIVKRGN